jgi:hypothetical protein
MKEYPILFSTQMVKAILEGRKTMTRRVVKPQPEAKYSNGDWYADRYNHTDDWCFWGERDTEVRNICGLPLFRCPYGQTGDRLWVRETFVPDARGKPIYRADCDSGVIAWKPSIFMPRNFSRITLEITNVRVERLQSITAMDATKEGSYLATDKDDERGFVNLWDSINGKTYPWASNPWVWVIEFKRGEYETQQERKHRRPSHITGR